MQRCFEQRKQLHRDRKTLKILETVSMLRLQILVHCTKLIVLTANMIHDSRERSDEVAVMLGNIGNS